MAGTAKSKIWENENVNYLVTFLKYGQVYLQHKDDVSVPPHIDGSLTNSGLTAFTSCASMVLKCRRVIFHSHLFCKLNQTIAGKGNA